MPLWLLVIENQLPQLPPPILPDLKVESGKVS